MNGSVLVEVIFVEGLIFHRSIRLGVGKKNRTFNGYIKFYLQSIENIRNDDSRINKNRVKWIDCKHLELKKKH